MDALKILKDKEGFKNTDCSKCFFYDKEIEACQEEEMHNYELEHDTNCILGYQYIKEAN